MKRNVKKYLSGVILSSLILFFGGLSALADNPATSAEDITPPVLKYLELKRTTVGAPGKIEIAGYATDDVSGISSFSVSFCRLEGKTIRADLSKTYWATRKDKNGEYKFETTYADGNYHGYLEFDRFAPAGEYYIESVSVGDEAGNCQTLYGFGAKDYDLYLKNEPEKLLPDKYTDLKIRVTNTGIALDAASSALDETAMTMGTHLVQKGDTLWGLAKKYGTTVDDLMSLNPDIVDRSLIYVGQLIKYRK